MDTQHTLPIAVIGAGPIGLAAAVRLLEASGWESPRLTALPYGGDLIDQYLAPLAALPAISSRLQTGARVLAVTRAGLDKTHVRDRDSTPFVVRVEHHGSEVRDHTAAGVIDASGTWSTRNPLGTSGLPAIGEAAAAFRISSPLPDVTGRDRASFAGRLRRLVEAGKIGLHTGFGVSSLKSLDSHATVAAADGRTLDVDVVVPCTGFRPNLEMLRELRLNLDSAVEAPAELGPLIDPEFHSCGTVPPHGAKLPRIYSARATGPAGPTRNCFSTWSSAI